MQDRTDTSIGEYLDVLRRRWFVIVGTMLIAVVIVGALDLTKTPIYQASSQLLLQPTQSESIFQSGGTVSDPTRAVQNELKVINSLGIRNAVKKAFGAPVTISATSAGEDDVIILSATDTDPETAARKVNVYAKTFQTERLNTIVAELAQSKTVFQQQINDFQKEIDELNAPLVELDKQISTTPVDSLQYSELVLQRERLNDQITAKRNELQTQLNDYQQRLQILQLSERLTTTGGVQILNPASAPSSPISPNLTKDLIQAALIGLFIGIALAFLLEQLDDSVRSTSDMTRIARDVPALGLIPRDEAWKSAGDGYLTTLAAPMGAPAEAYRGLRTSLQYLALDRPMGIVQITSASSGEGKTSTAANLAVAFADAGISVAVVGCDLRRPRVQQFFDVDGSVGLTSVLLGSATMDQALQQSPKHPNIRVLPSGPRPPNPSELLSLDRTGHLIRSLLQSHSIVFLDCPPVLPVTDSLVLSRAVDATLFIAMANQTSRREMKQAIERLRQVSSPLIGTILNGVAGEGAYGSMYEYYGTTQPGRRRRFRKQADTPVPPDARTPQTPPTANGHTPRPPKYSDTGAPSGRD